MTQSGHKNSNDANSQELAAIRDELKNISKQVEVVAEYNFRHGNRTRHVFHYLYDLAKRESADFMYANLDHAVLFTNHLDMLAKMVTRAEKGAILEFGVFTATSTNTLADAIAPRRVYGFDSFEGLREDWAGHDMLAGAFDLGKRLPAVRENVQLVAGWVQDTLPSFLTGLGDEQIAFVHFDLDTYESTRFTLETITPKLAKRVMFVFDEYHSYPGWKNGEKKAFEEWVARTGATYKIVGYCWEQAAMEVVLP